ncbi:MAG: hypothetical protein ACRDJF_03590, partial [Actinomycetota bacterium]
HDDIKMEIDAWQTTPGRDTPEAQLYALDQLAESPGGQIGWRADSKRIIVWFGDAAGHDPVCKEISGLSYDITEASVTAKLAAETITVVALSMSTNFRAPAGLDDDPTTHAAGYKTKCGAPGGQSQQGSRIASATGGKLVQGVSADSVVQTIIGQVAAQVAAIGSLRLVATGAIAPFVSTISPTGGHGPLGGDRAHEVSFGVSWIGAVPCTNEPQVFNGSFDVVADGNVVGGETVKITVPACAEIPPEEAPVIDDNGGEVKGKERVMAEAKCMDADDLFQGFRGEFSGEAGRVGRAAGIFVGVLTGARAGSVALPIPVVGTLAGAVVGGVLGSKTGRWLGRGLIKGTAAMAGKVSSMTAHIAEGGGQPSGSQAAERL